MRASGLASGPAVRSVSPCDRSPAPGGPGDRKLKRYKQYSINSIVIIWHIMIIYIYIYIYIGASGARRPPRADLGEAPEGGLHVRLFQSYMSKGIWRQGIGSFVRISYVFNTMPCRHMPLLVHFRLLIVAGVRAYPRQHSVRSHWCCFNRLLDEANCSDTASFARPFSDSVGSLSVSQVQCGLSKSPYIASNQVTWPHFMEILRASWRTSDVSSTIYIYIYIYIERERYIDI